MIFEIKHKISGKVLFSAKGESFRSVVETAIKARVSLRDTDMRNADMQCADMRNADMRDADMQCADMRDADMRGADMRGADMRGANMRGADMQCADMRGADWDFSCFPLWCGSFNVKVDMKFIYQMCYHICKLDNGSKEHADIKIKLTEHANKFHRIDECGEIK